MNAGWIAGIVVAALAGFFVGMIVSAIRTRDRLERIVAAARELARGNLARRVIVAGDDRIGELASELNTLADSIQEEREVASTRDKAHKRFIANISHDLRTPITSIAGYVDALQRGIGDEPERYLEVIASKTDDLARLTDDLFYSARLDADDLELMIEPLDLAEAARRSVLGFEPQLAAIGASVRIDVPEEPCVVDADASAVERVLTNLIANAVGHAPHMTRFCLELAIAGDAYTVTVSNDGGELPEDPEQLFRRGMTGSGGGSGLGLAIAHELATRMGATLQASSSARGDVRFALTFSRSMAVGEFKDS